MFMGTSDIYCKVKPMMLYSKVGLNLETDAYWLGSTVFMFGTVWWTSWFDFCFDQ